MTARGVTAPGQAERGRRHIHLPEALEQCHFGEHEDEGGKTSQRSWPCLRRYWRYPPSAGNGAHDLRQLPEVTHHPEL
jgi:hypothetical protein